MELTYNNEKDARDFISGAVYEAAQIMDKDKVEAYVNSIVDSLPASVKEKGALGDNNWVIAANMWEEYHKTHKIAEFFSKGGSTPNGGQDGLKIQGNGGKSLSRRSGRSNSKREFKPSEMTDAANAVLASMTDDKAMQDKASMSASSKIDKVGFIRPSTNELYKQGLLPKTVELTPEIGKHYATKYAKKVSADSKAAYDKFIADCNAGKEVATRYNDSIGSPAGVTLNRPSAVAEKSNIETVLLDKDGLQDFLLMQCALTIAPNADGVYATTDVVTHEEQSEGADEPTVTAKVVTRIKNAGKLAKDPTKRDSIFFIKTVDTDKKDNSGRVPIDEKYSFKIVEKVINNETGQEETKERTINPTVTINNFPAFKLNTIKGLDIEKVFGALKPSETSVPKTAAERQAVGEKLKAIYAGAYGGDFENKDLASRLKSVLAPMKDAEQAAAAKGNQDGANTMKA